MQASSPGSPPEPGKLARMLTGPLPFYEVVLAAVLIGLLTTAVVAGWVKAEAAEVLGLCTGLCSVWLALREHPLTWLATLINTVAFAAIFWTAAAYGNFALQLLQFALCLYGWIHWARGREAGDAHNAVGRATRVEWLGVGSMTVVIVSTLVIVRAIDRFNLDALDALSSAIGFSALFLQARKRVECWPVWIVAMCLMAPILVADGSVVMMAFVPLGVGACLAAWVTWHRASSRRH
jgi:nicotinamide mononucleotide transporter